MVFDRWIPRAVAHWRLVRKSARDERGFSIIEVVVSALIVALIAGATATALIVTSKTSADQRAHSQAAQLAQQDQQRLQGMSIKQLANLSQNRTVTLDGTVYTVNSTGQFLSNTGGGSSCTSNGTGTADFVYIKSRVTWPALGNRTPVDEESIITPPSGGSLNVQVNDQTGTSGLAGATVSVDGPDTDSATTNSAGCTIFGGLSVGNYTVGASRNGYVDADGDSAPTVTSTVNSNGTSNANFVLGQAGQANVSFTSQNGSTTYTGQQAPSISWYGSGQSMTMSNPQATPTVSNPTPASSISTGFVLFPFLQTGNVYTNNYVFWAGSCGSEKPPTTGQIPSTQGPTAASVSPGANVNVTVPEPGINLQARYRTFSSTTTVAAAHVRLYDSCSQNWFTPVRSATDPNLASLGSLLYPGQPNSSYTVCADFNGYRGYASVTNNNYSSFTTVTDTIDSTNSVNHFTC
jgi:Tfp pilus assembly protein PilV